jgi:uncharacterized membrane protein
MDIKPGVKTTEFWMTLVPMILLVVKSLTGVQFEADIIVNGILGAVTAISTVAYIWSRVSVKREALRNGK